jgi:hypothetical protein
MESTSLERLLSVFLSKDPNPFEEESSESCLSFKDMEILKEGLYWSMQVIPMVSLIPPSKICLVIEKDRWIAKEWLSRAWQYKRYHISNVSQLPLEEISNSFLDFSECSSNQNCFDAYWDVIINTALSTDRVDLPENRVINSTHTENLMSFGPSLALLDVIFYLMITFANSTGKFSDPVALRKDAQIKLCRFIHRHVLFCDLEPEHFANSTYHSNRFKNLVTPHVYLFMDEIMRQSPGSLAHLNLILIEQYALQGMYTNDMEKKLAAISLYQSLKQMQGHDH